MLIRNYFFLIMIIFTSNITADACKKLLLLLPIICHTCTYCCSMFKSKQMFTFNILNYWVYNNITILNWKKLSIKVSMGRGKFTTLKYLFCYFFEVRRVEKTTSFQVLTKSSTKVFYLCRYEKMARSSFHTVSHEKKWPLIYRTVDWHRMLFS